MSAPRTAELRSDPPVRRGTIRSAGYELEHLAILLNRLAAEDGDGLVFQVRSISARCLELAQAVYHLQPEPDRVGEAHDDQLLEAHATVFGAWSPVHVAFREGSDE
jgi:hypothetical protein